ncbi:hypothetical protein PCANC_19469 [Puccinia coronata f. sp. avenae]|uniref:Uncharacterized protein n=2 Tax=Puccinia coronata f. sp. avenae TaxID=200324 RepID=A0A2N5T1I5_9BASI|nr:hypothetical protein PCANC_19469 [Puccinia coronata f. sp. avenae]PLW19327.1 hypothetical protein PCASD_15217 [Puccinia coronata f. sp. avenae]
MNSNRLIATVTSVDVVMSAPPPAVPSKARFNTAIPSPTAFPQVSLSDSTDSYTRSNFQGIVLGDNGHSTSSTKLLAIVSTSPLALLPTSKPTINSLGVEQAPSMHTSNRAIATTLIVLLFVFGIFFIAGYWGSDKSSRWKSLRWTRHPESQWTALSSNRVEPERYTTMSQALEGGTEQDGDLNAGVHLSSISPRSKSRRVKSNPLQSYLNYRRGCTTLEEIDEEVDSMEQTTSSRKSARRAITPGLGPARYRLKTSKWGVDTSMNLHVKSGGTIRTNPHLASSRKTLCIPHTAGSLRQDAGEGSHQHLIGDLDEIGNDVDLSEFGRNHHRRESDINQSSGASHFLTRLKASIMGGSKLSGTKSSGSQSQRELPGTSGKEVADWDSEEEFERKSGPEDASELRYLILASYHDTPTKDLSGKRELSLADIPLPELPALAWNMTTANSNAARPDNKTQNDTTGLYNRYCQEMTTPTKPRHDDWMLSSRDLSSSSCNWASPETPTRKPAEPTPNLTENRTYFATSRLNF